VEQGLGSFASSPLAIICVYNWSKNRWGFRVWTRVKEPPNTGYNLKPNDTHGLPQLDLLFDTFGDLIGHSGDLISHLCGLSFRVQLPVHFDACLLSLGKCA
jgi:hypothetical protein